MEALSKWLLPPRPPCDPGAAHAAGDGGLSSAFASPVRVLTRDSELGVLVTVDPPPPATGEATWGWVLSEALRLRQLSLEEEEEGKWEALRRQVEGASAGDAEEVAAAAAAAGAEAEMARLAAAEETWSSLFTSDGRRLCLDDPIDARALPTAARATAAAGGGTAGALPAPQSLLAASDEELQRMAAVGIQSAVRQRSARGVYALRLDKKGALMAARAARAACHAAAASARAAVVACEAVVAADLLEFASQLKGFSSAAAMATAAAGGAGLGIPVTKFPTAGKPRERFLWLSADGRLCLDEAEIIATQAEAASATVAAAMAAEVAGAAGSGGGSSSSSSSSSSRSRSSSGSSGRRSKDPTAEDEVKFIRLEHVGSATGGTEHEVFRRKAARAFIADNPNPAHDPDAFTYVSIVGRTAGGKSEGFHFRVRSQPYRLLPRLLTALKAIREAGNPTARFAQAQQFARRGRLLPPPALATLSGCLHGTARAPHGLPPVDKEAAERLLSGPLAQRAVLHHGKIATLDGVSSFCRMIPPDPVTQPSKPSRRAVSKSRSSHAQAHAKSEAQRIASQLASPSRD